MLNRWQFTTLTLLAGLTVALVLDPERVGRVVFIAFPGKSPRVRYFSRAGV